MSRGIRRQAPVVVVAVVALVAALGGTVYAAGKIDGHSIKVKSLPGNRLAVHSVPANRLKPGLIQGDRLAPGSVTGVQVDVSTLGQVPSAAFADKAESAQDAETALKAVTAENAERVNGYEVGCKPDTVLFAGACWQVLPNGTAMTLPNAAASCANEGGELPNAFALAAFGQQPGITIASGDEWSDTIATFTGTNSYSVATVTSAGEIGSALSTATKKFRCVIPILG